AIHFADIFVIDPFRLARSNRDRLAHLRNQLLRLLIHAHHRTKRIVGPLVHFQNLLHVANERRVLIGRNAPHFLAPRLQLVFFIARRTVSCETVSTISNSTKRSASKRSVQRANPCGGFEHAKAVRRASFSPSNFGGFGGVKRGFRSKSDRGPCSTACFRHDSRLRVVQPYASATSSSFQAGPSGLWSHLSRACARCTFHAAVLDFFTNCCNSARSSRVNLSTYFLAMARPP